jgi:phosphoglycerate dehydrogenase-like enzyme
LNADLIARLQPGAQVVLISRAWCTDFEALVDAASAGRIQLATDVFPKEPLSQEDNLRQNRNVILSPHRAAAAPGGRWLIGDMILSDVRAILNGEPQRQLKSATATQVDSMVAAQKGIQAP